MRVQTLCQDIAEHPEEIQRGICAVRVAGSPGVLLAPAPCGGRHRSGAAHGSMADGSARLEVAGAQLWGAQLRPRLHHCRAHLERECLPMLMVSDLCRGCRMHSIAWTVLHVTRQKAKSENTTL